MWCRKPRKMGDFSFFSQNDSLELKGILLAQPNFQDLEYILILYVTFMIFLLAILIPACSPSSPAFHIM